MKSLVAMTALFMVLTASAQTIPAINSMESQIRQRLASRPDPNLWEPRPEKPIKLRRGNVTYSGILVEMVKTDNWLELINPAAPPQYGSSEDNVVRDTQTGREGLRLFSIGF